MRFKIWGNIGPKRGLAILIGSNKPGEQLTRVI